MAASQKPEDLIAGFWRHRMPCVSPLPAQNSGFKRKNCGTQRGNPVDLPPRIGLQPDPLPRRQGIQRFAWSKHGGYRIARLPTLVLLQKDREQARNPFSWGRKIRLDTWSIRYVGAVDQDPEGRAIGIRQDLGEALRDLSQSSYVRIPATRTHGCPYPVTQRP